jgi:transposase InsO family protein
VTVQYLSIKYTERLAEAGIEPSVGSVGDSYDNAPAEAEACFYAQIEEFAHGGVPHAWTPPMARYF